MLFNSRNNYETPNDAKKTREKARQDRSLEKPGAKEKLLAKLPGIKREDKLFYYACMEDPEVRRAAISQLSDPHALQMLIELYPKNTMILRCCADNPNIAEPELLRIGRWSGDPELSAYVVSKKLQSESSLLEIARGSSDEKLALCALAGLQTRESLTRVLREKQGAVFQSAKERTAAQWPDQADEIFAETLRFLIERKWWISASALIETLQKRNGEFDKLLLDCIKSDAQIGNISGKCDAAIRLIGCVRSEQLLLDFAKTYEIEASRSGGKTHGEPKILDAVMARLSEQQLLAVIAEADPKLRENKLSAMNRLSQDALVQIALHDRSLASDAAKRIRSPEILRHIAQAADAPYVRETPIKTLGEVPGGAEILEAFLEQRGKMDYKILRAITDEDVLCRLQQKFPDTAEVAERLLYYTTSEARIVECLTTRNSEISLQKLTQHVSQEGRIRVATEAKSTHMRSLAAQTLLETGHVSVLHGRCRYCGGAVTTSVLYQGTIEAHAYWHCTSCGRDQHQTILGTETPLVGDFYIYEPDREAAGNGRV